MRLSKRPTSGKAVFPFLKWMPQVMDHPARNKVVVGGRRIRKTDFAMDWTIKETLDSPFRGEGWIVLPFRTQAKAVIWPRLIQKLTEQPIKLIEGKTNETDLTIPLVDGRMIRLLGADRYQNIKGGGPVCAAMDEFQLQDPMAWLEAVGPALADKNAPALFTGTPLGMNHFYTHFQYGNPLSPTRRVDWMSWRFPTPEQKTVSVARLEEERQKMGRDLYAQEFLAEFLGYIGRVVPQFYNRVWPEGNYFPLSEWDFFKKGAIIFGSMDWGMRATFHHWWAADYEGRIVAFHELEERGKSAVELAQMIRTRIPDIPRVTVLDKSCWRRESNLNSIAGQLMQAGLPVVESDSRIAESITKVRGMCLSSNEKKPKFMVLEGTCPMLVEQLMTLQYNERADRDEEKFNGVHDAIDSARYAVMLGAEAPIAEVVARRGDGISRIDLDEESGGDFSPVSGLPRY